MTKGYIDLSEWNEKKYSDLGVRSAQLEVYEADHVEGSKFYRLSFISLCDPKHKRKFMVVARYGKIGTSGQKKTWHFDSFVNALEKYNKTITAKSKRGYRFDAVLESVVTATITGFTNAARDAGCNLTEEEYDVVREFLKPNMASVTDEIESAPKSVKMKEPEPEPEEERGEEWGSW